MKTDLNKAVSFTTTEMMFQKLTSLSVAGRCSVAEVLRKILAAALAVKDGAASLEEIIGTIKINEVGKTLRISVLKR